ncbi:putative quinol monooxygenase [Arcticibacterium luteifluviistationis]|uniref:Antibiotic biosynthesis monooxygenase n=1 Tax=Arcticibacterium luteifluviistationis TaxID=1784714 RepID=A0A2Z4G7M7_9BACT|nr:putative quinol monooxygenase [Arcticibacterium luteifluviistationis]AWV97181.1 antibiotic biosynthesis monooxygenase [Arcticibacterium luteifluviistationis]
MITLIATITAKKDAVEAVKAALLNLVKHTIEEPGNIQYVLHQEIENPNIFRFYEQFKDQAAFEYHGQQPYIKAMASNAHLMEKPTVLTFLDLV